jgi:hypothetical protein
MKTHLARTVATIAAAAALPLAAQAQDTETWKFGAAIYGWVPAIGGDLTLRSGTSSIGVSMGEVLDSLEFAFMGTLEATYGKWGVWTDLVYASFGNTKTLDRDFNVGGVIPGNVSGQFVLDVKSWIWTLAGTYNLLDSAENRTDLMFGARLLDMTNKLNWTLAGNVGGIGIQNPGAAEASLANWDGVVGIKGRFMFGEDRRWFVNYLADVGTGESDLTYQGILGLGYDFGWGSVVGAWRYMGYEFDSSSHVQNLSFNGPLLGVVLRF